MNIQSRITLREVLCLLKPDDIFIVYMDDGDGIGITDYFSGTVQQAFELFNDEAYDDGSVLDGEVRFMHPCITEDTKEPAMIFYVK